MTFLQIISFFILLSLLVIGDRKKSIFFITLLITFIIVSIYYYYMPVEIEVLEPSQVDSVIELTNLPYSIADYRLTPKDNQKLIQLINKTKIKRIDGYSSFSQKDIYRISFQSKSNYMTLYGLSVHKDSANGSLFDSRENKRYSFKASKSLLSFLESIQEKYRESAFNNDQVESIEINLIENNTVEGYRNFHLEIPLHENDYRVIETYLSYKNEGGGSGKQLFINSNAQNGNFYSVDFKIPSRYNSSIRNVQKDIKLFIRGEILINGEYKLFQRMIDIKN